MPTDYCDKCDYTIGACSCPKPSAPNCTSISEGVPRCMKCAAPVADKFVGLCDTCKPAKDAGARSLIERVKDYLGNGGLFNPELMEHQKVRDLIVDLRAAYEKLERENEKLRTATPTMMFTDKLQRELAEKNKAIAHYKKTIDQACTDYDQLHAKSAALVEALEKCRDLLFATTGRGPTAGALKETVDEALAKWGK